MIKSNKLIILLIVLIILIFTLACIPKGFENDLFFDLKTGESILKYGIDFKDHFSFIPNLIYIYHHWFYDVIIYNVYNFLGNTGLFLFFYLFFSLFGVSVYYINKKRTNNKFISLLVALITIYLCNYAFQSRVQSVTYLLFFLEVYFIDQLYEKGNTKYSFFVIIISVLIANLHMPLWIFSIILFLPYIFEFLFKYIADKTKIFDNIIGENLIVKYPNNKKIIIITFVILLCTGLLTPLKFYPYIFFIKSLFNNTYLSISEMSKTVLMDPLYQYELYLIILFIVIMFIKNIKVKLRDLCLIVGLFVFSFIASRNVIYTYIFYPTIFIKIIYESTSRFQAKLKAINKILKNMTNNIVILFVILWLIVIYIFCLYSMDFKKFDYGVSNRYPVESVKYIKTNLDYKNIKIYNGFGYGSYLEFNDIPVFIDSRAEVYIKEFNGGRDIVSDYLKTQDFSSYKKIFEKYEFDYALLKKDSNIYSYLKFDSDFNIIFEEENYVLFKRI